MDERVRTFRRRVRTFLEDLVTSHLEQRDPGVMSVEEAHRLLGHLGDLGLGPMGGDPFAAFRDPMAYVAASEEIARVWPSLNMMLTGCLPVGFLRYCSERTRQANAERLESGKLIGCLAVTEPGSGSDTARPKTTAHRDGDEYVLNGQKTWISNATISDMAVVVARDVEREERSFFVVDRATCDYETREIDKLGWRASPTGQMFFDGCRIPVENHADRVMERFFEQAPGRAQSLLEEGVMSGGGSLNDTFAFLRTVMAAMATGISQAAFEALVDRVGEPTSGDAEPLGRQQRVQSTLYRVKSILEASRRLTYRAAELLEDGGSKTRMMTSLAKGFATERCLEAAGEAYRLCGGGARTRYPVERYLRDARTMTIPDGTTEIQKLIVGYELTGLSAY